MSKIFISYRRDDSRWFARLVHSHIEEHFQPDEIFMDIDTEPGLDFGEQIQAAVESCDVLLAVIGPQWLTATDEAGQRRLHDEQDWVRLEIATALRRGIRVIPCLMEGTRMPRAAELPDELAALTYRQAVTLSHDRFRSDAQRLTRSIAKILDPNEATSRSPSTKPPNSRSTVSKPATQSWKRRSKQPVIRHTPVDDQVVTVKFLANLPDEEALAREEWLADLVRDHASSPVRRSAFVALRRISSTVLRDLSLELLRTERSDQNLRETAIKNLGVCGTMDDLKLLEHLSLTESIARFGKPAAKNAMKELLKRHRPSTQRPSRSTPKPRHSTSTRQLRTTEPAQTIKQNPQDGLEYVWIPPGKFQMGAMPGDVDVRENEKPRHRVEITRGFWLSRTPVTVAAYASSVGPTGRKKMPDYPSSNPGWSKPDHPMVNVTWYDAKDYCEWASGRLPTEAEWEYAARRGKEGLEYPWATTSALRMETTAEMSDGTVRLRLAAIPPMVLGCTTSQATSGSGARTGMPRITMPPQLPTTLKGLR